MKNTTVKTQERAYPVEVSFRELSKDYLNSQAPFEQSDDMKVFIVNNGTLRIAVEGENLTRTSGEGVLVNSDCAYKLFLVGSESAAFYELSFSPFFLATVNELVFQKYMKDILVEKSFRLLSFSGKNLYEETILDILNRIISANLIKNPGYELVTKGLLCYFWMELLEYGKSGFSPKPDVDSLSERRSKMIVEYITEHYFEVISLNDIAQYVHLSDSECIRCFQRVANRSPIDYLVAYRIYCAVRTLYKNPAEGEVISELAFNVGFNSPSYFNRVFKKYMNCTPKEYRNMTKREPERAEKLYSIIQEEITLL